MKKVLSIFLSILMLATVIAAVDLSSFAANNSSAVTTAVTYYDSEKSLSKENNYVYTENPVYYSDDGVTYSEVESAKQDAATTYVSVEEAIEQVRDYLEARTTSFSVSYRVAKKTSDMEWNYIFDSALEETGVPTQGDYIRLNYKSLSGSLSSSQAGNGSEYNVTANYSVSYRTTAAQEKKVTAAVADVIKGFGFTASTSDYDKIVAIYDYVCNNVTYDYKNLNNDSYRLKYTAYAALINGTSVCQGYALLLYRLMMECGISCRVIESDGHTHAWNIVKLGTQYYNVDATWDSESSPYEYFLKSNSTFNKDRDHKRESQYKSSTFNEIYPMATSDHTQSTNDTVEGEHDFSTVKTLTSPTCEHHGLKITECSHSGCYERYTEQVTATGHNWNVSAKADVANNKNGEFKCSACSATKNLYCPDSIDVTTSYTYSGEARKPSVAVTDSNGSKIDPKYYTVSYIDGKTGMTVSSIKDVGQYYVEVTIEDSSRYKGYTFERETIKITPQKTSIKKIKVSKKSFTVKWNRQISKTSGYQIQYSTNSEFNGFAVTTISGRFRASKKARGLKPGTKYYIRVRTYKNVRIDGEKIPIYSPWSSVEEVTTKK